MRVQFEGAMTESDNLILKEWKAMGTARRLAEQNDQLLDMLLDINEQPRAPARLRFNLDPAGTAAPVEPGLDPDVIRQQLQELRDAAMREEISSEEYTERVDKLHNSQAIRQTLRSLASLEAHTPHTTFADVQDQHPIDGLDLTDQAPGYMSPAQEEQYLLALDQALADSGFDAALQQGRPPRLAPSHQPLSDKDLTIRNPDSVYNWLRKNQPQVFLQDKDALHHENMSEKSAPHKGNPSNRKSIKRESGVAGGGTPAPRENEEDEPGLAPDTGKGRKKPVAGGGEDDTAYRPKGGSSRPAKRKREDGDTPVPKSKKKSRPSGAGSSA